MLIFYVIGVLAIIYIVSYVIGIIRSALETRRKSGIRGFYPNLTHFLKDCYDKTQVLKDDNLSIETKSYDYQNNRKVSIRSSMNCINRQVKINCVIKPNGEYAEQEERDFFLDPTFGDERDYDYGEQKVMREIKQWLKDTETNSNMDYRDK